MTSFDCANDEKPDNNDSEHMAERNDFFILMFLQGCGLAYTFIDPDRINLLPTKSFFNLPVKYSTQICCLNYSL
jgi:hypothetical protein